MKLKKTKHVAVTATTGMAGTQLGLDATTLHHWSSLGDGRCCKEELSARFMHDELFAEARERIRNTEVLTIDEIGMLSEVVFEKLELVCRLAKNNHMLFGGIQVIGCGDFKQLPPVPNYRYDDPGYHCFRSQIFKDIFPHHFNLVEVVRQSEKSLVRAINQLCDGCPDKETETLLKSLSREFGDQKDVCRLFGTNFDADYVNQMHLDAQDGELFSFKATDEGNTSLLRHSGAEKTLALKIGAPVILIRNLQGCLFNGLKGTVNSLSKAGPTVNFGGRLVKLEKIKFEVYDPSKKKILATRLQYPLKLAYALTVHRAQGQTLQKVEVDCYSFFAPGQMGVAIGRAVNIDGLRILNYNSTAANLRHPQEVYDFYFSESEAPVVNLSCCRHDYLAGENEYLSDKIDDTPEIKPKQPKPSTSAYQEIKCPWSVDQFLNSNIGQTFVPTDISDSFKAKFCNHADSLYGKIKDLLKRKTKTNEDFARLYKEAHLYLISEDHIMSCSCLEESPKPQKLSSKFFFWLLNNEIESKAKAIIKSQEEKFEHIPDISETISDAAKSKVRHLTGACIHKILSRLRLNVINKLGKPGSKTRAERDWDFRRYKLLKTLRISEDEAMKITTEPESMGEIEYKQGPSRGLLHVSDQVFLFFYGSKFFSTKATIPRGFSFVCRQNTYFYARQVAYK